MHLNIRIDSESQTRILYNLFFLFTMFLCGLIISKYILIVAFIYICLCFIKKTDVENYYLGLFLIPNIRIMDSLGVSYLINILLSVPLLILIIRNKLKLNRFATISTAILFGWELLHILFYQNYDNLANEISTFAGMMYCISIILDDCDLLDLKQAWTSFTLGIFASGLLYLTTNPSYLTNIIYNITIGYRFKGFASDPNYYALYICLSLAIIFIFNEYSILDYCAMFLLLIYGVMTASKMCVILMIFTLIFGFISCIKDGKYKSKREFIVYGSFILFTGSFLFKEQLMLLFSNLLKRAGINGSTLNMERVTSGRSIILINYLSTISTDTLGLFLGKGFQYHLFYNGVDGYGAHNTYLDVILAWGLLGSVAFYCILFFWIKNSKKSMSGYISLPLFVLLLNYLDLSCLSATMFWWVLSIGILTLSAKKNEEKV